MLSSAYIIAQREKKTMFLISNFMRIFLCSRHKNFGSTGKQQRAVRKKPESFSSFRLPCAADSGRTADRLESHGFTGNFFPISQKATALAAATFRESTPAAMGIFTV